MTEMTDLSCGVILGKIEQKLLGLQVAEKKASIEITKLSNRVDELVADLATNKDSKVEDHDKQLKKLEGVRQCASCDKAGKKVCSACRNAFYCSKKCQMAHWVQHKPVCILSKNNSSSHQQPSEQQQGPYATSFGSPPKQVKKNTERASGYWV